jgi:hypothetical protein
VSDRELDMLVAVHVLGWKRVGANWYTRATTDDIEATTVIEGHDDIDFKGAHDWLLPPGCDGTRPDREKRGVAFCGCRSGGDLPRHSSTWSGMGRVVEAMQAKGWLYEVGGWLRVYPRERPIRSEKAHRARFYRPAGDEETDMTDYVAVDLAAPRAVALAALRALGVEIQA